jgi:hypothetical protein
VQFTPAAGPPPACPICEDERQYVGPRGQEWTTLEELRRERRNVLTLEEPGLLSIRSEPIFAIGQRALLVKTPEGNVLWDCITLVDDATIAGRHGLLLTSLAHGSPSAAERTQP